MEGAVERYLLDLLEVAAICTRLGKLTYVETCGQTGISQRKA